MEPGPHSKVAWVWFLLFFGFFSSGKMQVREHMNNQESLHHLVQEGFPRVGNPSWWAPALS